ncbi:MAG: glutathione S-transferase family protein [Alphaproteobacteria bacterium]|nr:glutathione S-transferase family protein [Alphaproteobacteria bacterium]
MYQLYYYPNNASLAPHFVLAHLDVPYDLVLVDRKSDAQKSADYLKLNPAGRIPTLVDGDLVLFESPAICMYLAEQHDSSLVPAIGSATRPRFLQWMMYLTNTLQAEYMVYCYPAKHTSDPNGASAVKAAHADRITGMFRILDEELETRPYLVGDGITVCDYFLFMLCLWAEDMPTPPQNFKHLGAYLKRMAETDVIQDVCGKESIKLGSFI